MCFHSTSSLGRRSIPVSTHFCERLAATRPLALLQLPSRHRPPHLDVIPAKALGQRAPDLTRFPGDSCLLLGSQHVNTVRQNNQSRLVGGGASYTDTYILVYPPPHTHHVMARYVSCTPS